MHVLLTRKLDVLAIMKKLCITFVFMLAVSWRLSECKLKAGRSLRRAVSQPPKQCSFHNVNFTVGETWNPFLEPKGYYRCIKCSCKLTPDGLIAMVECKSQCKRVRCRDAYIPPGECCRRCPGSNVSENSSEKEKKDCVYNGALHKHGEVWPKGPEKPNLLSENQCTECSCMDGFVTCATRTCPSLSCDQKEPGNGTCCRVCAGVPERGRQPSDCKTMNRRYSHMESWHPRLPPSNDLCTNCTCKNSTIHCSSQECPTVVCTNPVRKPGHCCLSCPADSSEKKPSLSSAENILIRVRTAVSKSSKVAGIIRKRRRKNKGECVWDKKTFPHNSWFSPTIVTFGVAVCVKCVCNASKIECERLRHKCPTNYTCKNPVSVPGECCKVCAGNSSQTPGNPLGTVGPALQPCSSGKNWRVFENRRRQGSEENANDRIWVQFALEDKEQDYVEIHFIEANMTHKTVQISATTKNDFHTFMGRAHQQNKFYQYEYIGQIREGRRIKIRDREQRPCPKTRSCVQSVRNFIDILRKRGRQCRAIASLPPKTLLMLRNKG